MNALKSSSITIPVSEYKGIAKIQAQVQWSPIIFVRSQWQLQALKAVLQTSVLTKNWDSYGSPSPSPMAVTASINFLTNIDLDDVPIPHVVPVPGGGIQFEWKLDPRELEVEILPDGSIEFLKAEHGEPLEEGPIQPRIYSQVYSLLSWLTSR